ncbi:sigma-70 family RNA polymerase sigma factor [Aestuariibacter halophilus]|uniref:Sigma-70 family RNA polymerase sigma factor n=1 Tax=Fluctibacter halophilus TaxID=226011 RepID=A0ABS8GDC1_9ALTE|nr:sigma-70 family RNA polymerase sigma factor [Aestuariibacter halophilus]MCC2617191.1 sigma-70 family RNA polymerase sigma factor [Aestuariibacter halophilus]
MDATASSASAESPQSLVARILEGDSAAEQHLVEHYWQSLFFILCKRSQDRDLSADIAQDAMLVALQRIRQGELSNHAAVGAFIRQIAINLLLAHYRKAQRRQTDTVDFDHLDFPHADGDLCDGLNQQKIQQLVLQVLDELPTERDRQILYRHFLYHQDKSVICDEFELTPAHFDRVLHRARQRLKQLLCEQLQISPSALDVHQLLALSCSALLVTGVLRPHIDHPAGSSVREMVAPSHCIDIPVRACTFATDALKKYRGSDE